MEACRGECECPRCRRRFEVPWLWGRVSVPSWVPGTIDAPKYDERVTCPHCGTRLKVWHEMWPEFYAEVDHGID